jgi:hypothetical protein
MEGFYSNRLVGGGGCTLAGAITARGPERIPDAISVSGDTHDWRTRHGGADTTWCDVKISRL